MSVSPPAPPPHGSNSVDHPVWDVYDEYRTARFNVKYYCELLERERKANIAVEITLALSASGSALGALQVFHGSGGHLAWQVLGVVAAALAVAKPLVNWAERIRKIEASIAGYRGVEFDLRKLEVAIREAGTYSPELQARFARVLDRRQELVMAEATVRENRGLKERCQAEVARELPTNRFFIPEGA